MKTDWTEDERAAVDRLKQALVARVKIEAAALNGTEFGPSDDEQAFLDSYGEDDEARDREIVSAKLASEGRDLDEIMNALTRASIGAMARVAAANKTEPSETQH